MDSWPISLQQKLNVAGFQKKFGKTAITTDMDVGPSKKRSRSTYAVDVYTCTIMLDYSEYSTFDTFFKITLNNGVNRFLYPDPFTQVEEEFRFANEPDITPVGSGGLKYTVSMVWEKMP